MACGIVIDNIHIFRVQEVEEKKKNELNEYEKK